MQIPREVWTVEINTKVVEADTGWAPIINTEATADMLTGKNSDEAELEQKLLSTQALDFCHGEQEDYRIVMRV